MGKIFLSHSSKDKDRIGQIANALGPDVVIYDELSFDDGQAIVDEIENGLDNSDMFVLFISDASLNSTWVNRELAAAQTRFRDNVLRFLPIIIDQKVNYTDPRIPDWVRETYILRYNGSLKKIIRLIKQKRIERSWQLFPHLRQKDRLFVGRNAIIDNIESKLYHVTDKRPNTIIASGIKRIGRKSTVIHTLRKNGYIGETYSPNIITLDRHSNIDNLLLALSDIGICENIITPKDLLCSIPEKIQTTATLLSLIAEAKEIIVIEDSGCIISPENEIADWFVKLSELTHPINQILNIITTPYRLHQTSINHLPILYFHIPELEREGLCPEFS
ncbi:toll/interleukin-1 receptor domain-containing protein [Leptonema illini]|uniref:toll/interleukin-1 receptor domain-containing protein n=1 Tax=Leptonema illini TaxID=183 RepID=UPI0002F387E8|nr:toll/interleukin-1 receptor domain-containing protein [Leptonema illini]